MKKPLPFIFIGLCITFFLSTLLTSCEKVPGHSTVVTTTATTTGGTTTSGGTTSGGTTGGGTTGGSTNVGVGPVAVGAVNTFIFQVKGTTYTWAAPNCYFSLSSLPVLGGLNSTVIQAINVTSGTTPTPSIASMTYNSTAPGTYPILLLAIQTTTLNLQQSSINVVNTKVTAENIHVTSTQFFTAAGTITGTFDGYLTDLNSSTSDSVRVSGSYNIKQ